MHVPLVTGVLFTDRAGEAVEEYICAHARDGKRRCVLGSHEWFDWSRETISSLSAMPCTSPDARRHAQLLAVATTKESFQEEEDWNDLHHSGQLTEP